MVDFDIDRNLYPFESRWFNGRHGRMHYIDEGTGAPIVFFHGNPTWSFLYRNIITRLRDEFRCIAMDYLGFGLSDRPAGFGYTLAEQAAAAGELLDHLGLDGFVTMGQDWGGPMSMAVATERADRVRGVILGNTWFWPSDHWRLKWFSIVMGTPPMQRVILQHNMFVRAMPKAVTAGLSPAEVQHYLGVQSSPQARVGVAELPKQIRAARPLLEHLERDVPRRLGAKPALLIWGLKDGVFPIGQTIGKMQEAFPDNVIKLLPNANHFFQEDEPEAVAAAISQRFSSTVV
jgi:haloalkane dehalogenase